MRYRALMWAFTTAGILSAPAVASGDETLDFFRRFLDASPTEANTQVEQPAPVAMNTAEPRAATQGSAVVVESTPISEPIRVAQRDRSSVPAPIAKSAAPVEARSASPAEIAAAKRSADRVTRQIENLQGQLEREEKLLQKRIAEFSRQREVALEKSDEATLKRIEKMEQSAVVGYEKRVQQLISQVSSSAPAASPGAANFNNRVVRPESQPVQRPVANRKSAATPAQRQAAQQRAAQGRQLPSWAQKKNQSAKFNSQQASKYKQQQQNAARQATPNAKSAAPKKKKRFKLWPFR